MLQLPGVFGFVPGQIRHRGRSELLLFQAGLYGQERRQRRTGIKPETAAGTAAACFPYHFQETVQDTGAFFGILQFSICHLMLKSPLLRDCAVPAEDPAFPGTKGIIRQELFKIYRKQRKNRINYRLFVVQNG